MLHLTPLKSLLLASALALLAATPASAQEKFRVITTFTVIADMAQNVAGDAADVSSITKPGAEIHDYQPTPGNIKRAQGAQLILSNGLNLERWFARFYQHLQGVPEVVVSEGIQPMGISAGPYSGKPNPHAWMSADNALIYVDNIRDALVKYDPPHADTYRRCRPDWRSCRRISAGWSPAREPSPIWPATMACANCICGRSMPTSRAPRSRCARLSTP